MAFDPFRAGLPATTTMKPWIKRYPWRDGGSQLFNYTFVANIGIDLAPPRFPLQPNDVSRIIVYWSGPATAPGNTSGSVLPMTIANIDNYKGITMNPAFAGNAEQVVEKNAIILMPVGSMAVVDGDFVQADPDTAFATQDLDVVPQRYKKQWIHVEPTAVTAAVNLLAGYAVGTRQILIDTINIAFALHAGMTITITTGGVPMYYLISAIDYNVPAFAGADALITLAWPLTLAVVNNDVITAAHAANIPIYFQWDSEWSENLLSIESAFQIDISTPDADSLATVAFAAGGIAANQIAIVPSGAFTHPGGARGGIGVQLGTVLQTGDQLVLMAYFHDKLIRQRTIGFAEASGAARTSATVATEIPVELKE